MLRRAATTLLLTALAGAVGCASSTTPPPHAGSAGADYISPVIRGAENGLEMHWWIVEGSPELLREAVGGYVGAPCGVPDATRDELALSGLRLVRVPLSELAALREALPVRGRTDRKWLGQAPWWVEALRGALTGETFALQHGRLISLPSGRLRVLARAWTAPGPVMRADVAIQHLPRLTELLPNLAPGDAARSLEPQKQGPVFEETLMSLEMDEGYAYLLVCDSPDARWPGEEPVIDPLTATYAPPVPMDEGVCGPPTTALPSLGERLLRRAATPLTNERSMTAVVVLAPRLPERYALLP